MNIDAAGVECTLLTSRKDIKVECAVSTDIVLFRGA